MKSIAVLAVLVPYDQYVKSAKRQIGVLQG